MPNPAELVAPNGALPGATILSHDPITGIVELQAIVNGVPIRYRAVPNSSGGYTVNDIPSGAAAPPGAAPAPSPMPSAPVGGVSYGDAAALNQDERQFNDTLAGTNWRFGTQLAETSRIADADRASTDARAAASLAEQARIADANRTSSDWQFGTNLGESARQTDNALNATNWRFGEGLAEDARQFNVGEMGTNDRARLAAASQGFQSVNALAPQLGRLALDNAAFTAQLTQNPADFVARAFFQRGGESPLPVVSQADLINQLTSNIAQYNNVLAGFNTQPLTNPQFLPTSQYGGYTNTQQLQQSPYGSYGAPTAPTYPTTAGSTTGSYPAFGSYTAPTGPAPTSFTPLTGTVQPTATMPAGTQPTAQRQPTTTTPTAPRAPSTSGGTTSGGSLPSYLSPAGDPWSDAAQNRYAQGLIGGSIEEYYPPPSEWPSIAQNADNLFTPDAGGQDFRFEVNDQGALVAIPMAFGGMTRAPLMMTGDHPSGAPTGHEELIANPTGAPLSVIPNPGNRMGVPTSPPSFGQMPPLPAQASPQATMSRFGGRDASWTTPRGFGPPPQSMTRAGSTIPRFADGTDDNPDAAQRGRFEEIFEDDPRWNPATMGNREGYVFDDERVNVEGVESRGSGYGYDDYIRDLAADPRTQLRFLAREIGARLTDSPIAKIPRFAAGTEDWASMMYGSGMDAGTTASQPETMAVTNNTSTPTSFYQAPPAGTTPIGMSFGAPQLPTQPQVTQQQLVDYARQYSPPAVSNVISGTMPETLRFGFPLPSPQIMNSLTPAERQALNTRLAVEFNSSLDDVEHAMRLRFNNARQRPRGRYAVGT